MILEIKNYTTSSISGGRSPSKICPDCTFDDGMWGPRGYLNNLYGIKVHGGELESKIVWSVLQQHLDTNTTIGYSVSSSTFFDAADITCESYDSVETAMQRGRFNLVYVTQSQIDDILPYIKKYSGNVVVRATNNNLGKIAQWYGTVVAITLVTGITYVLCMHKVSKPVHVTIPEFKRCSHGEACEQIFSYFEHTSDPLQITDIESDMLEPAVVELE